MIFIALKSKYLLSIERQRGREREKSHISCHKIRQIIAALTTNAKKKRERQGGMKIVI
jgi:hypothetical protein